MAEVKKIEVMRIVEPVEWYPELTTKYLNSVHLNNDADFKFLKGRLEAFNAELAEGNKKQRKVVEDSKRMPFYRNLRSRLVETLGTRTKK